MFIFVGFLDGVLGPCFEQVVLSACFIQIVEELLYAYRMVLIKFIHRCGDVVFSKIS